MLVLVCYLNNVKFCFIFLSDPIIWLNNEFGRNSFQVFQQGMAMRIARYIRMAIPSINTAEHSVPPFVGYKLQHRALC